MTKPILFSDTSVFQESNLGYFEGLRSMGVRFNFTKLTEDPSHSYPYKYVNPSAYPQIRNSLKAFGSAGVYHFWHGQNADFFLSEFKKTGLDPHTTKFALDVEDPSLGYGLAGKINKYFKQLIDYGFQPGNLWVYTSYDFIVTARIIVSHLKYGFVWVAKYATMNYAYNRNMKPSSSFRPNANAWQFNGVKQDLSYDYTGSLLTSPKAKPKKHVIIKKSKPKSPASHYLQSGHEFEVTTNMLNGYKDSNFTKSNNWHLTKGTRLTGQIVHFKGYTRLDTPNGWYSTNTKFLKELK